MADSPPTLRREVPNAHGRLFDEALDLMMAPAGRLFLAAVDHVRDSESWTADNLLSELERRDSLDSFMDQDPATDEFRTILAEIWEGPLDDDGKRERREEALAVECYLSASDAAVRTSAIAATIAGQNRLRLDIPRMALPWWDLERWKGVAINWAQQHAAAAVTAIDQATRAGIREIITMAQRFEPSSRAAIRRALLSLARNDGTIRYGLDAVRARIFQNWIDANITSDIPAARAEAMKERRFNQLLRARSATIAQTEAVTVANASQIETYGTAVQDGVLDAKRYILEWVARSLRCRRCGAMDTSTREILAGRFVSDGSGPKGVESAEMPDLHPSGWCFTRSIRRDEAVRLPG